MEKTIIIISDPHGPITILIEQTPPPLWYTLGAWMLIAVAVCWICVLWLRKL